MASQAGLRRKIATGEKVEPPKIWKAKGPEQKELNRLFENGIIDRTDTPKKIWLRNAMFQEFSTRTFAQRFRLTKAKYGLNASAINNNREDEDDDIPELYGSAESRPISRSPLPNNVLEAMETRNFPYITWQYTDHSEKRDIVCVVVPMVSGSEDIRFVLSDDGMSLSVDFIWPSVLLDPEKLFRNLRADGERISMDHPCVYAFQSRLLDLELSKKSRPGTSLVIPLPVKVQRELGTYKTHALEINGTEIAMMEFFAFQKKQVISDADNAITFNRHRE